MHKQLRIWQIFSYFLRFLHQIWLFCPKMSYLEYIIPVIVAYILYNVMDYPSANVYTIWSSNIHTTDIFQFLAIFAQNLAILPQKLEVPRFPEVYQTFSHFCNIIETNHSSRNSQGSTLPTHLRCPSLKLHIKNVQVFILSYFTYFCHILLLKNHFFTQKLNCILVYIFFSIDFKSVFFNITFDAWN